MTTTTAAPRTLASVVAARLAARGISRGIMCSRSPERPDVVRVRVLPGAAPSGIVRRIGDTLTADGYRVTFPADGQTVEATHPADAGAPALAYDYTHAHSLDAITGHDVIASSWDPEARGELRAVTLTVTAYVPGAAAYGAALDAARAHRTGPGAYGYTAARYACGCRQVAEVIRQRPGSVYPAPIFRDLPA